MPEMVRTLIKWCTNIAGLYLHRFVERSCFLKWSVIGKIYKFRGILVMRNLAILGKGVDPPVVDRFKKKYKKQSSQI